MRRSRTHLHQHVPNARCAHLVNFSPSTTLQGARGGAQKQECILLAIPMPDTQVNLPCAVCCHVFAHSLTGPSAAPAVRAAPAEAHRDRRQPLRSPKTKKRLLCLRRSMSKTKIFPSATLFFFASPGTYTTRGGSRLNCRYPCALSAKLCSPRKASTHSV